LTYNNKICLGSFSEEKILISINNTKRNGFLGIPKEIKTKNLKIKYSENNILIKGYKKINILSKQLIISIIIIVFFLSVF